MAIEHHAGFGITREEIYIRELGLHDLAVALAQGWDDFLAKRGDLIFIGLFYPTVVLAASLYALNTSLLYLLFPLAAGSILFGPAAACGFYELARRREQGLDARWRNFLDVVHGPSAFSLFALTAVVTLLFLLWIAAAGAIYSLTLGLQLPANWASFVRAVFTTPEGWVMIVAGNLVGLGFAILTLAISVISFPMLVDRPVGLALAVRTSLRVTAKNPVTIAAWGLIVVAMLVLGSLPALIGLAVVLPVLGYATWHLYTRAVVR